jgi:ERCC4-related helicase
MLREGIEPRLYQQTIFNTAIAKNTLCVLPTGMGKTLVAELTAIHRLQHYPKSKILFLAPTRPLVQQHLDTFKRDVDNAPEMALFTGNVTPAKRQALWESAQIIFSTPQGLENDLISGRISLKEVSLLIVDEAHRAVGDYAYVFLAEQYMKQATHGRILALTASPGSDKETVEEICRNLAVEEIELRTEESPDVKPYIQEIDIEHVQVAMPAEFKTVHTALKRCFEQRVDDLKALGTLNRNAFTNKTTMLKAQGALHANAARGQKSFESLKSMSLLAEALKVQHAIELIETQGVSALDKYFTKLQGEAAKKQSKAVQNVVQDVNFKTATILLNKLKAEEIEHPKLRAVKKILLRELYADKGTKVIIFNQYRDQAQAIKKALDSLNIDSRIFVGQMKKGETGMTQKEQHAILEEFRGGGFNVLIATSVAEEGLDIPKVDTVLFYEPIPSAIRTVQRRGRTGRLEKGRVIMLVTEGTRDVAYKFAAKNKEKRMHRVLQEVKRDFSQRNGEPLAKERNGTLASYEEAKKDEKKSSTLQIVADHREKASGVLKELLDLDIVTPLQQLEVGDYLLSDRVVVEYKRVPDFVDSIIDGRLLQQLRSLRAYRRPLIVIEGEEDLYSMRKVHPNAILGMLSTIMVSYNIPLIFTKNARETASLLAMIARKEQEFTPSTLQQHGAKPATPEELLEYVVSSLPNIGTALGKRLLEHFSTIKGIATASEEELASIEKLGPKKAKQLHDFFNQPYKE